MGGHFWKCDHSGDPRFGTSPLAGHATFSPNAPDLIEASVSDPPAAALPGAAFSATDTVRNQGGVSAATSTTSPTSLRATRPTTAARRPRRFRWRARTWSNRISRRHRRRSPRGASFAVTDTVLNQSVVAAGATSSGTVTVTVPSNMALGTYYLIACADNTTTVTESDETNNCRASATTVQVTVP